MKAFKELNYEEIPKFANWLKTKYGMGTDGLFKHSLQVFLRLSIVQRFIRETRGVHIEIMRNASGYYWGMCMEDGGTNLGWSDRSGPNDGGVWDTFDGALQHACMIQLAYKLPKSLKVIKHWSNYADFAFEECAPQRHMEADTESDYIQEELAKEEKERGITINTVDLAETPGTPIGSEPRESIPISENPMSQKDIRRRNDMLDSQQEKNYAEYQLILQKKSKLSASRRADIVKLFN